MTGAIAAVLWGLVLGGVYFGGLWLTTRALTRVSRPGLWFAASYVLRVVALLAGIYVALDGRWQTVLAVLLGLLVARTALLTPFRPPRGGRAGAPPRPCRL